MRHDAYEVEYFFCSPGHIEPADGYRAGRFGDQCRQDIDGRGLAGAIRAEEREQAPFLYGKADAVYGFNVAVVFLQVLHLDYHMNRLLPTV